MLPIVPFETHAAAKALTAAGAGEKIAVAVVEVAQEAAAEHGRELATRADVARLSVELAATRTDVETVRAGIETVREATRADVAELRAESGPHGNPAHQKWVVGTALVIRALAVGVLRLAVMTMRRQQHAAAGADLAVGVLRLLS